MIKPHRHIEMYQPYKVKSKIHKCDLCEENYIKTDKHKELDIKDICLTCYARQQRNDK